MLFKPLPTDVQFLVFRFLGDNLIFNLKSKSCPLAFTVIFAFQLTLQKFCVTFMYPSHMGYVNYQVTRKRHLRNILLPKCGIPPMAKASYLFNALAQVFPQVSTLFPLTYLDCSSGNHPHGGLAVEQMDAPLPQDFPPCLHHFPFLRSEHCLFYFPENQRIHILFPIIQTFLTTSY